MARPPTTLTEQRADLVKRVELLKAMFGEAALAQAEKPSEGNADAVGKLNADLRRAEDAVVAFDAAVVARGQRDEEAERKAAAAQVEALSNRIKSNTEQLRFEAMALVEEIIFMGPRYKKVLNLLRENREASVAAVRLAGNAEAVRRFVQGRPLDGHSAITAALGSALCAAFAQGSSLAPAAILMPPMQQFSPEKMDVALGNLGDQILGAIERATAAAEKPKH